MPKTKATPEETSSSMRFAIAMKAVLEEGAKIAREGWEEGMYVCLESGHWFKKEKCLDAPIGKEVVLHFSEGAEKLYFPNKEDAAAQDWKVLNS